MPTTGDRVAIDAWTLVELTLGGRVFRFTSSPEALVIVDFTSSSWTYEPGLNDIPARFGPSAGASVAVAITAPPGNDDTWSELVASGFLLDHAPVTVRRWWAGFLEDADILIEGKADKPRWGSLFEPVSFAVNRRRREAGVIPPSQQVIGPTTWPVTPGFVLDPAAVGASYPWVFGRLLTGTLPAYLVEFDRTDLENCRLHFAGHCVGALEVEVFDAGVSIGVAPVVPFQDKLGVWCSTCIFATLDVAATLDREYRVAFNQGGGGWAPNPGDLGPSGAYDILEQLLRAHGDFKIDWARGQGARARLNNYDLGVPIVAQAETWSVVQAILGIMPADWVQGARGAYPKLRVMSGGPQVQAGAIDCSRETGEVDRTGRQESAGPTVFNWFTIKYGLSGAQQRPENVLFIGSALDDGGELDLSDVRLTPSYACQVSEGIYGRRPKAAITTELVHEAATARLILEDLADHHPLPRAAFPVRGSTSNLDRFDSDDVLAATALDISVDEPVVIRDKVAHDDGTVELQVMILVPLALRRRGF